MSATLNLWAGADILEGELMGIKEFEGGFGGGKRREREAARKKWER
jgi:hypothetical protein